MMLARKGPKCNVRGMTLPRSVSLLGEQGVQEGRAQGSAWPPTPGRIAELPQRP